MCDNVVALGNVTADGSVIFGKNSDREPNEPQGVFLIPRAKHPEGSVIHCTYIDIPQVAETNAVLLSSPTWLWGAEMGANEHGLVIGNTAVFTRESYDTGPGLIGMDYLRLALERTASAREALDLITSMLQQYGQSGSNGYAHPLYYHNSFLICDPQQAWVLETSGRRWAACQVKDIGGTSNTLTIEREWDLASPDLIEYAVSQGWCKQEANFNFKASYGGSGFSASHIYTIFGNGDERQQRLTGLLEEKKGQITAEVMMHVLRDHGPKAGLDYTPGKGLIANPPCMHAGPAPVRVSQTTGSLVSHLAAEQQTHWITGTSAPCTSIFKPVWIDAGLPDLGATPTGRYSHASQWWRHEVLHREVLRDYSTRLARYSMERDEMEARFLNEAAKLQSESRQARSVFVAQCASEADEATARWTELVRAEPVAKRAPIAYRRAWGKLDKEAGLGTGEDSDPVHSPAG
ncbi:MAG: peptidase U34 [Chloroflexi bacterium]|jgi:dipeptidase|nr:peptidase U34 [Chloroflexota bacterium]